MDSEMVRAMKAVEASEFDPVRSMTELPLRALFFPLGFPLEIHTNSPAVLAAAEQSWGLFQPKFSYPPLTLRLGVGENASRLVRCTSGAGLPFPRESTIKHC